MSLVSFARAAGAYVVLHDGSPTLYLERSGRVLQTLPAFADPARAAASLAALSGLLEDGRLRSLQIERIDGVPVAESRHRDRLRDAGFRSGYRGMVLAAARQA